MAHKKRLMTHKNDSVEYMSKIYIAANELTGPTQVEKILKS